MALGLPPGAPGLHAHCAPSSLGAAPWHQSCGRGWGFYPCSPACQGLRLRARRTFPVDANSLEM